MKTTTTFLLAILVTFGMVTGAIAQNYSGDLGPGDNKLTDDEYYDTYYENFTAGQRVTVTMRSSDFDSYLVTSKK